MSGRSILAAALAAIVAAAPVSAQIVPPDDADPGAVVAVGFERAPAEGALLRLREIATDGSVDREGPPLLEIEVGPEQGMTLIEAPARPGSYRLELVENGRVRHAADLEVAAPPSSLTAPPVLGPGKRFEVRWEGADFPGDRLEIRASMDRVVRSAELPGERTGEGVTEMVSPDAGGTYRLVYVDGKSGTVLASQQLRVVDERAWMRSPGTVSAGRPFTVTLFGPTGPDHAVRVLSEGGDVLSETPATGAEDSRLDVPAPRQVGRYRLRYVNVATGAVLSDLPLVVR